MGLEIERKFLVNMQRWKEVAKPQGTLLRQGYLVTDPHKTIRVRIAGNAAFITIKGITTGATRPEYEYVIPAEEAAELLSLFATASLHKTRYEIKVDDHTWEVDVFHGENEGLLIAEIELGSEDESFSMPEWAGIEVTGDERYYNSNLSLRPFKTW